MQIIDGIKTFKEDLIVDGDVVAPRINNVNIMEKYNDGVQNIDGNVDIFGDLVSTILKESRQILLHCKKILLSTDSSYII